jgi:hypothetical protein
MVKIILSGIFIAIIGFVVVTLMQPDDFRISRSAKMSAPPAVIFAHVNDLHQWEAWSPWVKLDPNAKSSYEGEKVGVGSIYSWDGNNEVGAGSMTITESHPHDLILIKLEFLKPFKATHTGEFTFKPDDGQTLVTWSMYGKNNFIGKALGLVMNCDKMVGDMFDKGLTSLKGVVESTDKK